MGRCGKNMHRAWTVITPDGVEHRFSTLLDAVNFQTQGGGVIKQKSWRA